MSATSKDVLRFVNVVFRHGNRAPANFEMSFFGTDEPSYNNFHPLGLGQLTDEGKHNMYILGTKLSDRYKHFLGAKWIPESVEAHSTGVSRTKISMGHVLAGLYRQPEVETQEIPIIAPDPKEDPMLCPWASIPKYLDEVARAGALPEVVKRAEEFRELANKLSAFTAIPVSCVCHMWVVWNGLMSLKSMNRRLPKWADGVFPEGGLLDGTCLFYQVCNYNDYLKRINSGVLLKKMIDDMKTAAESGSTVNLRKINLFASHEMNIVGFLVALGLYEPHVPECSSAVILELIQREDAFYVKVVRYLGVPAEFEDLLLPGCEALCPLDKFIDMTKNLIPSDDEIALDPDNNEFDFLKIPEQFKFARFDLPSNSNVGPKNKSL